LKKLLRRLILVGLPLIIILALGALWFLVTGPVGSAGRGPHPPPVTPDRLQTHAQVLGEAFVPRDCAHPENLERAAGYIRQEFGRANAMVTDQKVTVPAGAAGMPRACAHTYHNIFAAFGPDTEERLVVAAHYDAPLDSPGADDNVSGVAGLIELAYALGVTQLPIRVELVALAPAGSATHGSSLKENGKRVRAVVAVDSIGYFQDAANSQRYPSQILNPFYPSTGNFIYVSGDLGQSSLVSRAKKAMMAASTLPVYSLAGPQFLQMDLPDHVDYHGSDYPTILISDTGAYRNPNHGKKEDAPGTLDYNRMAMVVQGVYNIVTDLTKLDR
jgi:hypothetical protein